MRGTIINGLINVHWQAAPSRALNRGEPDGGVVPLTGLINAHCRAMTIYVNKTREGTRAGVIIPSRVVLTLIRPVRGTISRNEPQQSQQAATSLKLYCQAAPSRTYEGAMLLRGEDP